MANMMLAATVGEGSHLVVDLGLVLVGAGLAVLVFSALRVPVLFGYIVAGLLLGPNLLPFTLVENPDAIQQLSELGVIFLLFFIGMEFDLRRIKEILGPAFAALLLQTMGMLYLAHLTGSVLGWSPTVILFFGSLLAISSSMVTIRVLRVQDRMQEASSRYAIGILILEDILAVILLVVLTSVAVTKELAWDSVWLVSFLMGIFVISVYLVGRIIVVKLVAPHAAEVGAERLTLVSVGIVMGISLMALKLEFSPALGAFLAGAMLSQTSFAHRVEEVNQSLHDVFAAVFFVTTGMLLDPVQLWAKIDWILLLTAGVIGVKVFTCWLGISLSGQSGRTAFLASLPKSQIGEFSFIIAGLGVQLGVMDEASSALAYGVAFMTIFFTPLITGKGEFLLERIERLIPQPVERGFSAYRRVMENLFLRLGRSVLIRLIRRPALQIGLYFFLLNGILILASVVSKWGGSRMENPELAIGLSLSVWIVTILLIAPFILAIVRNLNAVSYILTEVLFEDLPSQPVFQGRLRMIISRFVLLLILAVTGLLFLTLANPYLPEQAVLVFLTGFLLLVAILLRRPLIRINSQMEMMFIESFEEQMQDIEEARRREQMDKLQADLPWPSHIREVVLPTGFREAGRRVRQLDLRKRFNVTILALGRGAMEVFDPGADTPLFPGDRLTLIGPVADLERATASLQTTGASEEGNDPSHFEMRRYYLSPGSLLDGETISSAHIRSRYRVTVVGIQRGERRIEWPGPDEILHAGDILYGVAKPRNHARFEEIAKGVDKEVSSLH